MVQRTETERLELQTLQAGDASFIQELVNSPGWLKFIGDRNVHSTEDALRYIERISNAPNITYWVVRTKADQRPIGIVTLIKRDYLAHFDIGFAFLPSSGGKGYAYEASAAILTLLQEDPAYQGMYAVTLPDNLKSIQLLTKLGFQFESEIEVNGDKLHVYALS
jgi:ribosomal-protein-alanine N-acetyltransferase